MMDSKQFFICILSDFINERKTDPVDCIDWKEILTFAINHQVAGIVYYQCKNFISDLDTIEKLLRHYSSSLYSSANVRKCYKKISDELSESKIAFVPVKGLQIAQLYMAPELRTMGDIDLLVHRSDFDRISEIFLRNEFEYGKVTEHEITFKKGIFYYEIHEYMVNNPMVPDELRKNYYNDYWQYLITDGGYGEQKLDWSFHFMFLLQHMRQHILWEGIGFRQFMDKAI